jgi:hypothetical protein
MLPYVAGGASAAMQPCSVVNPAGFALAGGAGAVPVDPPLPAAGAGGAVDVVVVVGATVVVVVVLGGVVVVVVDGRTGGSSAGAANAGVVVVVVGGAACAGGDVVVVVSGVAPEAPAALWPAAGAGSGAAVSVAVVHAPADCIVETSATSLESERVCDALSKLSFAMASTTALDVSCTWLRAAWYAAVAAWLRVTRSEAAMLSYSCATTPSALCGPDGPVVGRCPVGRDVLT